MVLLAPGFSKHSRKFWRIRFNWLCESAWRFAWQVSPRTSNHFQISPTCCSPQACWKSTHPPRTERSRAAPANLRSQISDASFYLLPFDSVSFDQMIVANPNIGIPLPGLKQYEDLCPSPVSQARNPKTKAFPSLSAAPARWNSCCNVHREQAIRSYSSFCYKTQQEDD